MSSGEATRGSYHHGDLRRVLIAEAIKVIAETGAASMSLREVARRAGVSHAAATHHFGGRVGLLSAIAVQGFDRLALAMQAAGADHDFLEVGVAYVKFAVANPGYFDVMFRPDLHDPHDAQLHAAKTRAARQLYGESDRSRRRTRSERSAALAAWSIVHGLASLIVTGNVPAELAGDPAQLTRDVAIHLAPPKRLTRRNRIS